jgi:hypothetical protein
MEGHFSIGQSSQQAVVPIEEEEINKGKGKAIPLQAHRVPGG